MTITAILLAVALAVVSALAYKWYSERCDEAAQNVALSASNAELAAELAAVKRKSEQPGALPPELTGRAPKLSASPDRLAGVRNAQIDRMLAGLTGGHVPAPRVPLPMPDLGDAAGEVV